jgi:acetyl esterase
VLGDKETHDRLIRELAVGANAVVVFVDYDRSPESRFPNAIEQSYAVTEYVAEHPAEFGADASRLAIVGDSVGGNMAAVVALMAKERKGPRIVAQLLFYPVTDASMSTASYAEFAEGPWLTKAGMAWFWDQYLPDASKRGDVHASPLNASVDELAGLPQALQGVGLFGPNGNMRQMPAGGPPYFTNDQIRPIIDWINAGCPNPGGS